MRQLPLPISLRERAIFENYVAGNNQQLVNALKNTFSDTAGEQQLYIWSRYSVGKTHLLQSLCHLAAAHSKQIAYVPLVDLCDSNPEIFSGLESLDAVCIDDLHKVVEEEEWSRKLFTLINACRDAGTPLILSANEHPYDMQLPFEDLRSRLLWGAVYHLKRLSDAELVASLFERAKAKGLDVSSDAANFLVKRLERDTAGMLEFLDKLDTESLVQQRRITIPLIKTVMQEQDAK